MRKGNVLTKWMRAGVLGLALIIFPCVVSVSAQNQNANTGSATARETTRDDDTDYGWIGLLGLAGLAGLLGRKRDDRDRDRDRK